jgi:PKD repeat protein
MKRILTLFVLVFAMHFSGFAQTRTISGEIKSNMTLYSDTLYKLSGYVYVKNNATITIQPGTIIQGVNGTKATLVITRNGKINAQGTAAKPIIFTSDKSPGSRAPGDWGGIVVLGKATTNRSDCTTCPGASVASGEAGGQNAIEGDLDNTNGDGLYGGTDDSHSSGTLSYIRIEFGGIVISPGNEINGLTMGGVGSGTTIDHIQCSYINDDGFEWFGGTVNAKYLISYHNVDDDFDTDFGFRGKVQFGIAQRDSMLYDVGSGPTTNGFESDNDGSGTNATPYTEAIFSNMTIIGPLANGKSLSYTNSFQNGARIRRASAMSLFNSVIIGFPTGVFIDGTRAAQKLSNDSLLFKNNVIGGYTIKSINAAAADQSNVTSKIMGAGNDTIKSASGILEDPFNYTKPNFAAKSSTATSGASFSGNKISNSFFTSTSYKGAVSAGDDWTKCWTSFDPQNEVYNGAINYAFTVNAGKDTTICAGKSISLNATVAGGTYMYSWSPSTGLSAADVSNPTASPSTTTTYSVTVMTARGCAQTDQITITVNPQPAAGFTYAVGTGGQVTFSNTSTNSTTYAWDFGVQGSSTDVSTDANPSFTYPANGIYTVTLVATNGICSSTFKKVITVSGIASPKKNVQGEITADTKWYADTIYYLNGYVYVKNNATLTIEPGTIVKGVVGTKGTLVITRNGKINAQGTKTSPIVFTSDKDKGSRAPSDWGGIVVLGKALINRNDCTTCPGASIASGEAGGQNAIEGDLDNTNGDGLYGGTDDAHSSGTISYVRIEFGGVVISPGNEINGLTMGGVGSGTKIDHVQTSFINDDGFEWFGGAVNAKNLISFHNVDDDFDTDFGFRGKVQFGVAMRDSSYFDVGSGPTTNGFESDNDGSGTNATPYTEPVFSNMTIVGPLANGKPLSQTNSFQNGARIRRASGMSLANSIIMGFPTGIFIDGTRCVNKLMGDTLLVRNNIIAGYTVKSINAPSNDLSSVVSKVMGAGNDTLKSASGILKAPFNYTSPDWTLASGSTAASGASFSGTKLSNSFFTPTSYRGAFGTENWTQCWAKFNPQNEDYSAGPIAYTPAIAEFSYAHTGGLGYQFTNNSGGATKFFWDFGVSGSTTDTSTSLNPNFIFPAPGNYIVTLTAMSDCGDSTITKTVGVVGLNEGIEAKLNVNVYPNPTKGILNIAVDIYTPDMLSMDIYTMAGQKVKAIGENHIGAGSRVMSVNVEDLSSGMYLLRLLSQHGQRTVRFTIAR